MSPIKLVIISLAVSSAIFAAAFTAFKMTRDGNPAGVLTLYGGSIYYVDTEKLHVTSGSGKHNIQFKSFYEMSVWLEEVSAREYNEMLNLELNIAMGRCLATVLPDGEGVRLDAENMYTKDTVTMTLSGTLDGKTFYNE